MRIYYGIQYEDEKEVTLLLKDHKSDVNWRNEYEWVSVIL